MIKAQALRDFLGAAIPELAANPDRMLVFIDKGSVVSRGTGTLAFEYTYVLNIIFTDFASSMDVIMAPLFAWVGINEPQLVQNSQKALDGVKFTAEILSNNTADISVTLPLTEAVGVKPRAGGGYDLFHFAEPRLIDQDDVRHWDLYVQGDDTPIASWDAPA